MPIEAMKLTVERLTTTPLCEPVNRVEAVRLNVVSHLKGIG
jgi:hypothetical protein